MLNMHFVIDPGPLTDTSHVHCSQILLVTMGKSMRSGRSRRWEHERAATQLTTMVSVLDS